MICWDSLKHGAVILIPPDQDLRDGADGLHQQVSVVLRHRGVLGQDVVHVPGEGRGRAGRRQEGKERSKGALEADTGVTFSIWMCRFLSFLSHPHTVRVSTDPVSNLPHFITSFAVF